MTAIGLEGSLVVKSQHGRSGTVGCCESPVRSCAMDSANPLSPRGLHRKEDGDPLTDSRAPQPEAEHMEDNQQQGCLDGHSGDTSDNKGKLAVAGVDNGAQDTPSNLEGCGVEPAPAQHAEEGQEEPRGRDAQDAGHLKHPRHEENGPPGSSDAEHSKKKHKWGKAEVARNMLSFGDEIEEEDMANDTRPGFSSTLGAVTAKRFQHERPIVVLKPVIHDFPPFLRATDGGSLITGTCLIPLKVLGDICVGAAAARGARPYMEDYYTVVRNFKPLGPGGVPLEDGVLRTFAGLYDGHNGIKAADHANARLHMALAQEAAVRSCTGDGVGGADFVEEGAMGTALRRVFHVVDQEILDRARAEGGRDGATALVVLRVGSALFTAHAGDSRAVLCRNRIAIRLTQDHKPNLPKERQRVEAAGGRVDFQRCWRVICEPRNGRPGSGLAVSRSFGDLDFKEPDRFVECEPDIGRHRLGPEDSFVILASDGLWDVMDDQTACNIAQDAIASAALEEGSNRPSDALARAAGESLMMQALQRSSTDNVTVVVLLFQWG
eukprot:jgi/Botrbrau1/22987/Bobra.0030s0052.2